MTSHKLRFQLALPAEDYLSFYKGQAQNVVVNSIDGRTVQFPASAIRKFLTHEGGYGVFEIEFDEGNKLVGIERIG